MDAGTDTSELSRAGQRTTAGSSSPAMTAIGSGSARAPLPVFGGRVHAAEPTIRLNVALTCDDINALTAWRGWPEIESRARAAGASQAAIDRAKQCLK